MTARGKSTATTMANRQATALANLGSCAAYLVIVVVGVLWVGAAAFVVQVRRVVEDFRSSRCPVKPHVDL